MNIVQNILTPYLHQNIINLMIDLDWKIAKESNSWNEDNKTFGLSRLTFENNKSIYETELNVFGVIIAELVAKQLNIKIKNIERFMWNYYRRGEEGKYHIDREEDNFLTMLYSFNTSDGCLDVDGKKFTDVEGDVKVFNSNISHKGIGPIKDLYRFNLNIVVEV